MQAEVVKRVVFAEVHPCKTVANVANGSVCVEITQGVQGPPGPSGVATYEDLVTAFDLVPEYLTRADALAAGKRLFTYAQGSDEGLYGMVCFLRE